MRHIRPTGRPLWWSGREVQLTPAVLLQTMWCPVQLGRMSESLSARPRIGQQSSCGPATSGFKVLATKRPARRVRRVKRDASSHIVAVQCRSSPSGAFQHIPPTHLPNRYRSCAPQAGKHRSDDEFPAAALAAPRKCPCGSVRELGALQRPTQSRPSLGQGAAFSHQPAACVS